MTRVATLQYMRSVGQAQMRWLGIEEGHHSLSHDPDGNKESVAKLQKINTWFAGEFAYLARRLLRNPRAYRRRQHARPHAARLDQTNSAKATPTPSITFRV